VALGSKNRVPVLWQLRVSIFSEKARWGLDYKGLPYRCKDLPPGLHSLILWLRGRGSTVPVVDLDGRSVRGSSDILAALDEVQPDPPLLPADERDRQEALELEDFFDENCGHEVRRIGLDPILRDRDVLITAMLVGRPSFERRMVRALHPVANRMMRTRYGIDPARVEHAHEKVAAAFGKLESCLRPSGYLVADHFTVADLTAAALLAPLVMPPEYPDAPWKAISPPSELVSLRDSLSEREGFGWVLETYRRHRGRSAAIR
jgi:glutathione S-transferase